MKPHQYSHNQNIMTYEELVRWIKKLKRKKITNHKIKKP